MRRHSGLLLAAALALSSPATGQPAYRLEPLSDGPVAAPLSAAALLSWGVDGLHVGCALGLAPRALNSDVEGLSDGFGGASAYGVPAVLAPADGRGGPEAKRFFLQHDATTPFPIEAGALGYVYAEHFIEHIPRRDAVAFVREARRLLKPGGVLRLSTPDLAVYADAYRDPSQAFFNEHRRRMTTGPMEGRNAGMRATPAELFNTVFYNFGHKHLYDLEELEFVVAAAAALDGPGARACRLERASFQRGAGPAHLDDELHVDESLYAELVCD